MELEESILQIKPLFFFFPMHRNGYSHFCFKVMLDVTFVFGQSIIYSFKNCN